MKKLIIICAVAALVAGCKNNSTKPKDNGLPKVESKTDAKSSTPASATIAYVDIDTLMAKLTMFQDANAALEAKAKKYHNDIAAKQNTFQKAYADFQKKMQTTGYASQTEFENAQKHLQKLQDEGAKLEMKYSEELQKEQEKLNNELRKALHEYLAVFNADKRYSMILGKGGDNILYADPALDITDAIVEGMNANYKKEKK